ncbi:filamentous hemagglutinin N-terminal domain-containing protein [Tolypothrix sp. PCC 7910]|uniref:two-partner secretion domain-containing protein n=1 Tax=Tolypothrix sp. PCC 7910 TaxID=2099387 RepID=UPI001AD6EABA|nr:filamentous hemagglutinin N-terminal domain-containing protein [Tolypothrix sp. PCC 7910]
MSKIILGKSFPYHGRDRQIISLFFLKNYKSSLSLSLICAFCGWLLLDGLPTKAIAQITPNPNDTNTVVNQTDNTFNIQGGTQTGTNLFHSFEKFGLNQGQTANFISNPSIQNILGRVTGGEASIINGLIQVTGGNSNLFLMNPAGIIFGPNASLNVPAAFTATTASGIGFNNQWFNAVGTNSYSNLTGNPNAFAFTQPGGGAIINGGLLKVSSGQSLTLLGGTVISTGVIEVPGGKLNITAVQGEKLVRISQEGNLLNLGLPVETKTAVNSLPFTPLSLPELLTGGNVNVATGVTVENGVVKLLNTNAELQKNNTPIQSGDVVVNALYSKNATISADNNFIFEGEYSLKDLTTSLGDLKYKDLTTSGDLNLLAQNKVQLRDFFDDPDSFAITTRVVQVGGNLKIQGNQGIEIQFNARPGSLIQTGGDLSLISDDILVGNARFATGGNFSVLNLSGSAGNLTFGIANGTPSQPIISSNGDVNINTDYNGPSLKIEARGNISTRAITINDKNIFLQGTDPDIPVLATSPSLILRAGLEQLRNTPTDSSGTVATSPGSITVNGNINMTLPGAINGRIFGPVILSGKGDINVKGNISNEILVSADIPSPVILNSSQGSITVGDIKAGNSMLVSAGNIIAKTIENRFNNGSNNKNSDIAFLFSRTGNITLDTITIKSGSLDINAAGVFQAKETVPINFQFSGPTDVPGSVIAARQINIQHGQKNFGQGLGVEQDQSGNPIYRVEANDKQVFFRGNSFLSGSNVVFRDKTGNLVVVPKGDDIVFTSNQVVFVDENEQFVSDRPITVKPIKNFDPTTVASNVSYTRGLIILQEGTNLQLTGVYQDTQLGASKGITVVTVSPGGGGNGGGGGGGGGGSNGGGGGGGNGDRGGNGGGGDNGDRGVNRPDDAQRQLTRQPTQNDICQPTNTGLTLSQRLKQARRISVNGSTSGGANTCEGATQDNNLLQINPDNRTQPIRINLNSVPQSRMNHHS